MHTGLNHGRPGFNNAAAGRSLASMHCLQSKRCCQGDHIMVLSPCACMHTGGTAGAGTGTNRACPVARRCSSGVVCLALACGCSCTCVRAPRAYTHARTGRTARRTGLKCCWLPIAALTHFICHLCGCMHAFANCRHPVIFVCMYIC